MPPAYIASAREDSKPGLVINAACASGFLAELKISRLPGSNMKKQHKNMKIDCCFKNLYRSHFGSRYKLGCCGHAGLMIMMRVFDSPCLHCIWE